LEQTDRRALGLREQRGQQVSRFHGLVARRGGLTDRDRQGCPGQRRQPLNIHLVPAFQVPATTVTGYNLSKVESIPLNSEESPGELRVPDRREGWRRVGTTPPPDALR